jgi:uncharacterized protein (TIGR02452 family)
MIKKASKGEREKRRLIAEETVSLSETYFPYTGNPIIHKGGEPQYLSVQDKYNYPELIFRDHGSLDDLDIINKKTIILNFASGSRPGGGFLTGALAQEEDLCLKSNLYKSISKEGVKPFYSRSQQLPDYDDNIINYTDYSILSNKVLIFRDKDMIVLKTPIQTNFITCAALNMSNIVKRCNTIGQVRPLIYGRVISMINSINSWNRFNNFDTLILGAWGCGVFNNPPEAVADSFITAIRLTKPNIKKIYFNIKNSDHNNIKDFFNNKYMKL